VKIYVAAVEAALRIKERQDETQFTTKVDGFFLGFTPPLPPLNANVLFCTYFLKQRVTKQRIAFLLTNFKPELGGY